MAQRMILSVDDDEDILLLLATLFGSVGYGFQAVSNPRVAHEKILQTSPDLVLIDLLMPDFDGFSLITLLKSSSLTSTIPIVVLSGLTQGDNVKKAMTLGADDFIQKPFDPTALLARVNYHIDKKNLRDQRKALIERYVNPHVAKKIFSDSAVEDIKSKRVEIVVLFADIREFTYLMTVLEPEDLFKVLNHLLDAYSEVILGLGGTIDKFIGDGIMAFWGAPLPSPDKEVLAVEAALGMLEATRQFNEKRTIPGGLEIQVGIGMECGQALVGVIGGEHRKDYTAIGEVVNLASRFEGMAGRGEIIIGDEMNKRIRSQFSISYVGQRDVKGVSQPVKIYKVVS